MHFPPHHRLQRYAIRITSKLATDAHPTWLQSYPTTTKLRFKTKPIPAEPHYCAIAETKPTALWKEDAAKVPSYTELH